MNRLVRLVLFLASVLPQTATAQEPTAVDKAFGFATAAEDLAKEGDFDGAIRFFQKAYDLVHDPVLLYNIGRMHDRKGDLAKAREFYERYLREEKDPEGRERGTSKLDAVLDRIPGRIEVMTEPAGAEVSLDGHAKGASPLRLDPVPRGLHEILVHLSGYDDETARIQVLSGEESKTTIVLKPAAVPLTVACDCPGSRVDLDGQPVGSGPLEKVMQVQPGRHAVAVVPETGDGLLRIVEVAIGRPARLELKLRPEDALVRAAETAAASGDLDGAIRLYRKACDLRPEPGIRLSLAGVYEKKGDSIQAREQYETVLSNATSPQDQARAKAALGALLDRVPGRLSINVDPAEAVIAVDGTRFGTGPFASGEVRGGAHEVRATLEGYEPAVANVTVKSGEETRIALNLRVATVALTVVCDCPGARVELDGTALGLGSIEKAVQVTAGHHVLRVTPVAGEPVEKTVEVAAGRAAHVELKVAQPPPPRPTIVLAPVDPPVSIRARGLASVPDPVPDPVPVPVPAPGPVPATGGTVVHTAARAFPWHWVAIGTGAALVVSGGILTGLAARDRAKITGAGTENGVSVLTRTEALALRSSAATKDKASYALYAVGGAAVATGVVFWILDLTRRPVPSTVPALSAIPDGVVFGASGRF